MLLWESLNARTPHVKEVARIPVNRAGGNRRLPFETRCIAITKAGKRCKGKHRPNCEYCAFHDPELAAVRKQKADAARAARKRRQLTHLPDGYLGMLNSRRTIGDAMDRLYREIRVGRVNLEMGKLLFSVLTRLMDSGLCNDGLSEDGAWDRTKALRVRPKLKELLTDAEKVALRRAADRIPRVAEADKDRSVRILKRRDPEVGNRSAQTKRSTGAA